jgi:hypothetical protein
MSATAMPREVPSPVTNAPSLKAAEAGYREMVSLLTRRKQPHYGGIRLGDPKEVLIGLTLDDATPLFVDPFQMGRYRTLLIAGKQNSGKRFAAELLRLRASWTFPKDTLRIVDARASEWTEEARGRKRPWRFPLPRIDRKTPREGLVLLAENLGGLGGHDPRDPSANGEFPSETTLLLNSGEGPERAVTGSNFLLTDAEHEWLSRARLPKEAGYSEGLLVFGRWHWKLPIAVVASTPEYEYIRSLETQTSAAPVDDRLRAASVGA